MRPVFIKYLLSMKGFVKDKVIGSISQFFRVLELMCHRDFPAGVDAPLTGDEGVQGIHWPGSFAYVQAPCALLS